MERIPAGRWGKPEDMAGAAVFLASQASNYVDGATIVGMARTIERGRGAAPRPSSGLPGAPQAPAG